MAIDDVIQEYDMYLCSLNLSKKSITQYKSTLRSYMKSHHLSRKQELKKKLEKQTHKEQLGAVFTWLNITPLNKIIKKYHPKDDPMVQRFFKERGLKKTTHAGYISSLKLYIPLCGFKSLEEMIQEAREDERQRIPAKEARIQKHLDDWKIFLQDTEHIRSSNSLHTYYTKVETVYRHYGITLPQRPPMKIKKDYHVGYFDLPDKEMISTAISQCDSRMASLIYFMSSSGTAKAETLSITVGMFMESLRDYTSETDPRLVVEELRGRRDLVPLLSLIRVKTNVPYYTCCSSEATYHILEYMQEYKHFQADAPLWDMKGSYMMKQFQRINDNNQWGMVGSYRKFRTHTLRKFHASNLGASFDLINTLEGRTNGVIHETYVKQNPSEIKDKYMQYMCNVMIHPEWYWYPGKKEDDNVEVSDDVNTDGNRHDTIHADSTGDGHGDMQTTTGALMKELIERIAVLEYRVKQLEQKGV